MSNLFDSQLANFRCQFCSNPNRAFCLVFSLRLALFATLAIHFIGSHIAALMSSSSAINLQFLLVLF
jgi:hypothetical protein